MNDHSTLEFTDEELKATHDALNRAGQAVALAMTACVEHTVDKNVADEERKAAALKGMAYQESLGNIGELFDRVGAALDSRGIVPKPCLRMNE